MRRDFWRTKGQFWGGGIRRGISEDNGEDGRRIPRETLEDDSNGEVGHIEWREKEKD